MGFPARGLPTLSGRWLVAYRLLWAAAMAAAFAATLSAQLEALAPTKLLHAFVLIGVAATLHRRRPTDLVAAMLSLAFLLWAATTHASSSAMIGGNVVLAFLDRLRFLLFVTAMLLFPSGACRPRWTLHAAAATFMVFVIGLLAAAGLAPLALYQPLAMGCAALAVLAMRQRFRAMPPGIQRQQIKWVALGLGAGLVLVGASRLGPLLVLPLATSVSELLFDVGVIVMAIGVLASLLRYRLYDADAAISRSTAYAALTVALVAVFAASEAVIQALSQSWLGGNAGAISGGIAAALAAALTAPLHQRLTDWTERHFQKALTDFRRKLPLLLADLRESSSLELLAEAVLDHVERALRISRAALLVGGEPIAVRHIQSAAVGTWTKSWLPDSSRARDTEGTEPVFPLQVELAVEGVGMIGWLLVGPRPDGSPPGKDERDALAETAGAVARALWIVQQREAREQANTRSDARLKAEIQSLHERLVLLEQAVRSAEPDVAR